VVILLVFLLILRRKTLAVVVTFLLILMAANDPGIWLLFDPARVGMFLGDALLLVVSLAVLIRFGLLALVSLLFVFMRLTGFAITLDTPAWYASTSNLTLIALAAIALYAFRTATAGYRPPGGQIGSQ
jgi:hypothetical protein